MTVSNLDRYQSDLDALIIRGEKLIISMQRSVHKDVIEDQVRQTLGDGAEAFLRDLPKFSDDYQAWYSESLSLIRQILPDRLADFRTHYERPKVARKDVTSINYVIEDFIQGLQITRSSGAVIVEPSAAIPRFMAQVAILKSCNARFKSSLFDIRQLVQADVFDSELEAARALLKNGFTRAAGAMAGVVLEHHLQQVLDNHSLKLAKKNPTLGELIQALKDADVIDTPSWRKLQHLGDLRNKCDHKKATDPTREEGEDLVAGAERIIKTLF